MTWKFLLSFLQGNNNTSPYSTVNQYSEISADGWTLPIVLRSNSCSEAENFYTDSSVSKSEKTSSCVLDEVTVHLYHCFKRAYADILHRWQLLYKKTEVSSSPCISNLKQDYLQILVSIYLINLTFQVMKLVRCKHEAVSSRAPGPSLAAECGWCGRLAKGTACNACGRVALRCAVCTLGVRGLACACAYCGHAGHAHHMMKW